MTDFSKLTLEQMVCAGGYDCTCGKHHTCALKYLKIERGAIAHVADLVRAIGSAKPFIICDDNTYAVAGKKVCELLTEAGIPHTLYIIPLTGGPRISPAEWEVGSCVMHFDPACDLVLGVGTGVVNDISKVLAHAVGIPSAIVGTAPSMDGYASNSSSMEVNHVKTSLFNHAPVGILLDTEILAQAPMRMLWAGFGDMIAKYVALCEWRISAMVCDEYYCEPIAGLMRSALEKIMSAADGIGRRDPDAIGRVAEGLIISGIAMAYAEISRPASGLEHYFSHMWEMMALERGIPYDLHGIQVGVGTLLTLKIYRRLRQMMPDKATAETAAAAFDEAAWEKEARRIFGKTAPEILRISAQGKLNDPEKRCRHCDTLLANWDKVTAIMDEELPPYDVIYNAMKSLGMPMYPSDIDLPVQDAVDAFVGSRSVRNKYLTSTMLWELGLTEDFAAWIAAEGEKD